jgi:hypothetical protein
VDVEATVERHTEQHAGDETKGADRSFLLVGGQPPFAAAQFPGQLACATLQNALYGKPEFSGRYLV